MLKKLALFSLFLLSSCLKAETVFIFAHGFGGNKTQAKWYSENNKLNWYILGQNIYSFDFPEVEENNKVNNAKANFAQEADIEALENAYNIYLKNKKIDKIVLVGVSRGASTIINFVATKNPKKLAAIVLESPFDALEKIIEYQLYKKYLSWVPGLQVTALKTVQNMYPAYKIDGIKPVDTVSDLPRHLPILIIHSKNDNLISLKSSQKLYKLLKRNGQKNVYLLELNNGRHASYQWSIDAEKYQTTVHAFYKNYGIECDKVLAQEGERYLLESRPTYFL